MRSIAGLTSVLVLLFGAIACAETLPEVREPMFGLRVAVADIRLERTQEAVLRGCGIARPGTEQMSWVFAEVNAPSGRYLALGGLARLVRDGRPQAWEQDWRGSLVLLEGERCTAIDPPRDVLGDPAYASQPVPTAIAAAVAEDAVTRLVRQFGGRQGLAAALRAQGVDPGGGPALLREAVERATR